MSFIRVFFSTLLSLSLVLLLLFSFRSGATMLGNYSQSEKNVNVFLGCDSIIKSSARLSICERIENLNFIHLKIREQSENTINSCTANYVIKLLESSLNVKGNYEVGYLGYYYDNDSVFFKDIERFKSLANCLP